MIKKLFIVFLVLATASCAESNIDCCGFSEDIVFVSIPPTPVSKLSDGQNWYRFHLFLHPPAVGEMTDPAEYRGGIPNDDSLLYVRLSEDGRLVLNAELQPDAERLRETLSEIFRQRGINKVYWDGSEQVVKAVGLEISPQTKFGKVMAVATAVRDSGAEPIVVLLDDHLAKTLLSK